MTSKHQHTDKFEELCAGYVLGALDPDEQKEFEGMLREASEEQQELFSEMRSAASQLAFTVERSEPSEQVGENLLAHVRSATLNEEATDEVGNYSETDPEKDAVGKYLAIAASFVLLMISLSLLFYALTLNSRLGDSKQIIQNQQTQITELQNEIQQKEELLAILESREVDMIYLTGMEANPNGHGKVIWDSDHNRALLQVSNLPPAPDDMAYQLWIIKGNRHISAGLFAVRDPQKDTFFRIEQMAPSDRQSTDAFAVTLEPRGGMPQPTGNMYLMGNMKKN